MSKVKTITIFATALIFTTVWAYADTVMCKCGDEGVTLNVVSGCADWQDAIKCSGWESVAHENGKSGTEMFPDKTQFTAFDCTIQINCPSSDNLVDAGSTSTDVKDDDSGWCSILTID